MVLGYVSAVAYTLCLFGGVPYSFTAAGMVSEALNIRPGSASCILVSDARLPSRGPPDPCGRGPDRDVGPMPE